MAMFSETERCDTNDDNDDDDGGVQLWNSNQAPFLNETKHSCLWHDEDDDNVTFLNGTASPQSTPPVEDIFVPLDIEGDDYRAEFETNGGRLTPPSPVKAPQSDESAGTELPLVPCEEYFPGVNDEMTGAVSLLDDISIDLVQDNNIICSNRLVRQRMPYKVLRRGELFTLGLPFTDDAWLWDLPHGFLTTFRGLDRAVEEFYACDPEAFANKMETDAALLGMIIKRGGLTGSLFQQVVYPEDIIPLDDLDRSPEGISEWSGEYEVQDKEYWEELREQGRIWDELYIP